MVLRGWGYGLDLFGSRWGPAWWALLNTVTNFRVSYNASDLLAGRLLASQERFCPMGSAFQTSGMLDRRGNEGETQKRGATGATEETK
jgi:hypothetical protein